MVEEYFDYSVHIVFRIFPQIHLQLIPFIIYYDIELNLVLS